MKNQELIFSNNSRFDDIKEIFMQDDIDEILVTQDIPAFNLKEEDANADVVEDFNWISVVDFGMKNIVCEAFYQVETVAYDKVTAVIVRYNDTDCETFINKNFRLTNIIY